GRGGVDRRLDRLADRALAVDRLAVGVEDAAEQAVAGAHRGLVAGGVHDGGGRNAFERAQRGQQGHLLGHAHHFGRQPELLVALAGRVAQDAQFADGRLQPGGADQGAVCLGDAADALDRLYPRQRAQQRIDRADRVLRLCRRCWLRCIHSWRPTPASAVRIASICWATPARTSPASDTTTQLSGSRLTSSTSSITPTAGCAWRTAPRPAATSSRTDGCTRIIRNCSACAASTACRTSGGTTLRASKSGAMRATIAQASSVTRLLASASTRARRSLSAARCSVICCCTRARPSAKPSAWPFSRARSISLPASSYRALTCSSSASSSSMRCQCRAGTTLPASARSNRRGSNTATVAGLAAAGALLRTVSAGMAAPVSPRPCGPGGGRAGTAPAAAAGARARVLRAGTSTASTPAAPAPPGPPTRGNPP